MENECELLKKVKELHPEVKCPIEEVCQHNVCVYLSDIDILQAEQEEINNRDE